MDSGSSCYQMRGKCVNGQCTRNTAQLANMSCSDLYDVKLTPGDCRNYCGDGKCSGNEASWCAADCGANSAGGCIAEGKVLKFGSTFHCCPGLDPFSVGTGLTGGAKNTRNASDSICASIAKIYKTISTGTQLIAPGCKKIGTSQEGFYYADGSLLALGYCNNIGPCAFSPLTDKPADSGCVDGVWTLQTSNGSFDSAFAWGLLNTPADPNGCKTYSWQCKSNLVDCKNLCTSNGYDSGNCYKDNAGFKAVNGSMQFVAMQGTTCKNGTTFNRQPQTCYCYNKYGSFTPSACRQCFDGTACGQKNASGQTCFCDAMTAGGAWDNCQLGTED
jgi:hypothetical protein